VNRPELALEQVDPEAVLTILFDTLEEFGINSALESALKAAGSYERVVGFLAECYLSDVAPEMAQVTEADLIRIAAIVKPYTETLIAA
jgi:hypothetical protein